jgi:hypothetical protein
VQQFSSHIALESLHALLTITLVPCYNTLPLHTNCNVLQLWALLHFLLPDVFTVATAVKFEEGFDLLKGVCDPERLRQARQLLTLLMLRRVKDQVDIPLPSKTELTLLVKLTPIQRAFYKHLLVSQVSCTAAIMMQLQTRSCCSHSTAHTCSTNICSYGSCHYSRQSVH